jgi:glycogen debranching enzyme
MPVEVNVGPQVLTINHGSTFVVSDLHGEIAGDSEQGMFRNDTRFVSSYRIYTNGERCVLLTSGTPTSYLARVYMMNGAFATEEGEVPQGTLGVVITRAVTEGLHEDVDVTNHGMQPVRFNLEIAVRSDFADLFEVKAHRFVRRGRITTELHDDGTEVRTIYVNRDFRRELCYHFLNSGSLPVYANGRATFDVRLEPGATWHTCTDYAFIRDHEAAAATPARTCATDFSHDTFDDLQRRWVEQATRLTSENEEIYRFYRQSVEDMGALRLYEHDVAEDAWLPAAGVPWFVALFGRDSLIASLQSMLVNPGFARGALRTLARLQATQVDDWRDAEPGKIPHDLRVGELAHFNRVPHTPYYGTADATPLYLVTLHEAWRWLGDPGLLRQYRDVALRCLEWIDRYGDLDGDGFQEYRTRSPQGYENMGWKDSGDAVVYPDGRQVRQPKALCELQGYVFDAWLRMAEVFDELDDAERAATLRHKAAELRQRFEAAFWCEDLGFYAFCLDPDKQPVRVVSSNAGHLLWSGIASPARAARVVRRFFEPDMWTGLGVRTLSSGNPAYNPFSYQRGSVWPHDNGIIALGFKRYGFATEAARLARDVSEAASRFASHRLPELYAGIERRPGGFPVQYLGANVPQAWAAGSLFHLLQAVLGIQADAPHERLYVDPQLPHWLPEVTLHGVAIGSAQVDLRFTRVSESKSEWDATVRRGRVEVQAQPWAPLRLSTPASEALRR